MLTTEIYAQRQTQGSPISHADCQIAAIASLAAEIYELLDREED